MEQGFTVDMGHGARFVSKWARGAPLKSFLFKTRVPANAIPIGTFRCSSCGYLESYAREDFSSRGQSQFSLRSLLVFVTVVAIALGIVAVIGL